MTIPARGAGAMLKFLEAAAFVFMASTVIAGAVATVLLG